MASRPKTPVWFSNHRRAEQGREEGFWVVVTQVYCQIGSLFSCILLMGTLFSVYVFMKVAQEEDKRKALGRLKKESESRSVVSDSLRPHRLHSPWNSPSQNTGVGSIPLLQGIFPTQGSNPGLPHCRQILYQLSHEGSPRILEWVAYPFSSRSSQPRNWTGVFCIAGRFFTNWAIREALLVWVTQGISTIFHILRCGEQALIYPSHTLLDMGYSYPS